MDTLPHYILSYYGQYMTEQERVAHRHLQATMKATDGRSNIAAQSEATHHTLFHERLSTDPAVLELTRDGYQAFADKTAQRILKTHGDKIFLNRCPQCGALARTPQAKQCRSCGHDWHGVTE